MQLSTITEKSFQVIYQNKIYNPSMMTNIGGDRWELQWSGDIVDNGHVILRTTADENYTAIGDNGRSAALAQQLSSVPVGIIDSTVLAATQGDPISSRISANAILDVAEGVTVTWRVVDSDAVTTTTNLYHEKADGSRHDRGGGSGASGLGVNYQASIDAWEPETPYIKLVLVTILTFADGNETTTETIFYKYRKPDSPSNSSVDVYFPAQPWYGTTDIQFTVYTDHTKTVEDRYLMVGYQRFDIPIGGSETITTKVKTGTHQAYVFASYRDGTSSKSDVLPVVIVGPQSPAEQAELTEAVDQRMRDTLTGPHAENLHQISTDMQVGISEWNSGNRWRLGEEVAQALDNERNRWASILDDPNRSIATQQMAISAMDELNNIINVAMNSANAWHDTMLGGKPEALGLAIDSTQVMQGLINIYFEWIRTAPKPV